MNIATDSRDDATWQDASVNRISDTRPLPDGPAMISAATFVAIRETLPDLVDEMIWAIAGVLPPAEAAFVLVAQDEMASGRLKFCAPNYDYANDPEHRAAGCKLDTTGCYGMFWHIYAKNRVTIDRIIGPGHVSIYPSVAPAVSWVIRKSSGVGISPGQRPASPVVMHSGRPSPIPLPRHKVRKIIELLGPTAPSPLPALAKLVSALDTYTEDLAEVMTAAEARHGKVAEDCTYYLMWLIAEYLAYKGVIDEPPRTGPPAGGTRLGYSALPEMIRGGIFGETDRCEAVDYVDARSWSSFSSSMSASLRGATGITAKRPPTNEELIAQGPLDPTMPDEEVIRADIQKTRQRDAGPPPRTAVVPAVGVRMPGLPVVKPTAAVEPVSAGLWEVPAPGMGDFGPIKPKKTQADIKREVLMNPKALRSEYITLFLMRDQFYKEQRDKGVSWATITDEWEHRAADDRARMEKSAGLAKCLTWLAEAQLQYEHPGKDPSPFEEPTIKLRSDYKPGLRGQPSIPEQKDRRLLKEQRLRRARYDIEKLIEMDFEEACAGGLNRHDIDETYDWFDQWEIDNSDLRKASKEAEEQARLDAEEQEAARRWASRVALQEMADAEAGADYDEYWYSE